MYCPIVLTDLSLAQLKTSDAGPVVGHDPARTARALKLAGSTPHGVRWPVVTAVLCSDITENDAQVVARLAPGWGLDGPDDLEELIEAARHV